MFPDRRGGRVCVMSDDARKPSNPAGGGRSRPRRGDDAAAVRKLRDKLAGVLRRLPDVERKVVELRMGLADGVPARPGEVAERLGLTIPEVKKIEERAFSRIREVVPMQSLERFLDRPDR